MEGGGRHVLEVQAIGRKRDKNSEWGATAPSLANGRKAPDPFRIAKQGYRAVQGWPISLITGL